jgi:PEGA domain
MPSLRLFRSSASRSAERVEESADAGLMAFAPETPAEPAEQLEHTQRPPSQVMFFVLLALVVLQAAPTFLWIKARFRPPAPPPVVAVAPVAPPASFIAAPPCEAAPAPTAPAPTPPAPATAPAQKGTAKPAAAAAATTPPSLIAGLVSITASIPVHVYLEGKLVGTSEAETIMLPVGNHELELRNDDVGYSTRRQVAVQARGTTSVKLDMPLGTLHVNAVPWADVSIDNKRVGETPIGNYQIPIGNHEVVFRHPELGERRTTVLVTAKEPARVSMDLRKK